jgi:hypothetical protein
LLPIYIARRAARAVKKALAAKSIQGAKAPFEELRAKNPAAMRSAPRGLFIRRRGLSVVKLACAVPGDCKDIQQDGCAWLMSNTCKF